VEGGKLQPTASLGAGEDGAHVLCDVPFEHLGCSPRDATRDRGSVIWSGNIAKTIEQWYRACPGCQLGKDNGRLLYQHMGRPPLYQFPFYKVEVDVHRPYKKMEQGNMYFWVCTDSFTALPVIRAVKTKGTREHGVMFAHGVVLVYGSPMIVGTDDVAVNRSEFVQSLNASLGISSQVGPQYSPTFVSRAERTGRTLGNRLRAIGATSKDWDLFEPYLNITEGARPREDRAGRSPFKLLYNCPILSPYDAATLALIMKEAGDDPDEFGRISFEELVRRVEDNQFWAAKVQEIKCDVAAD
jgi:hypothetical protein